MSDYRPTIRMQCAFCHSETSASNISLEAFERLLMANGWRLRPNPTCKRCVQKRKQERKEVTP